ncbi:ABC transporter ATP-binding protein [Brevundimonas sp. PAMC22021]|uniref:ABC transporter ATP-binding protein n=1 Tax=Brevundimonas sp. PAMC22021 TaxID=2861285 RepID=UPI001C627B38|nr:ABC transporter ATP-binding protein [Brevundimonas sp. PAMC22021]QYF88022.1 ABC transporter ATP-binding protein [Brevundimonas sp. PAMC22021]
MSAIELSGVSTRIGRVRVLETVSLSAAPGEVVALCGPNGAGKSSVIRAALGLLVIESGEVRLGGAPLRSLSTRQRAERAAYLPQDGRIGWNMPAVEVAALGAPFLGTEAALDRARRALDRLGIGHLADRGVADMSGGERARVLLARALTTGADALLADEPVASLDPDAQLLVAEVLRERANQGAAVLASLHDLGLAARVADRVVVVNGGRIVADGPPMQALRPEILREVFGLEAEWIGAGGAPLLATRRAV